MGAQLVPLKNMTTENKKKLADRLLQLGIIEEDIVEKFILGSGSGGQKVNKTSSCVYVHHLPTGIEIKCQQHRSRERNRIAAREELCDRIEGQLALQKKEAQDRHEKNRRRNRQPSFSQKRRMIASKRLVTEKKARRKVDRDE
ncbi:MAG: peptide chain release factor-like protein [Oligoflexales bacterium]|nr:peptide chain release factor-like protein [Oligoflexales bacterium]